jgi:hypothetical protein
MTKKMIRLVFVLAPALVLVLLLLPLHPNSGGVTCVDALGSFQPPNKATSKVGKSKLNDAIALYQKRYPQNRGPRKRAFNAGVGLPVRDLDGTKLKVAKSNTLGKTFSERSESELRATYQTLQKYFGDDDTYQMVQDFTLVLTMNRKNLAAIMAAYANNFGKDQADAMVKRNPGLLFCQPKDAATADNLTMQFSYVVAITRPVGPLLLYTLLALVFEPTFELLSGIPLKSMIFGS